MTRVIDLNCDMGELHPTMKSNVDHLIMPYVSSCNIACGYHSGSKEQIEQTIDLAIEHSVAIGAHPSYDDWENFGRVSLSVPFPTLQHQIKEQVLLIKSIAARKGQTLHHVKPHGALYNDMAADYDLASIVLQVIKSIDPDLKVYVLSGSEMVAAAKYQNITYYEEVFSDRRYDSATTLRSRKYPDAVITDHDQCRDHVTQLLNGEVTLTSGESAPINVDTICLHSDTTGAVQLASNIRELLKSLDVQLYQHM